MKYQNIKEQRSEWTPPDSSKLFFNHNLVSENSQVEKVIQIIKKRKANSNYFLFFGLAVLIIIGYFFQLNLSFNIYSQFRQFFNFRKKYVQEYSFIKSFIIHLLFSLLIAYQLMAALSKSFQPNQHSWSELFLAILIFIAAYILSRYFLIGIIATTFSSFKTFRRINQYWLSLLHFFICLSLPLTLLVSLNEKIALNMISYLLIFIFFILYVVSIIKIMYNEMNIIQTSVVKFVIYLYVVEFIPIILLVKHLRNFF